MPWQTYKNYIDAEKLFGGKDIKIGQEKKEENHITDGNII